MCRPLAQGGRRCPFHSDPGIAAIANAKTSVRRWDQKLNAAEAIDDETKMQHAVDKYGAALTRLTHREQACAGKLTASASAEGGAHRSPLPAPHPTKAGQYSKETVAAMSWDELADEYAALNDDPEAQERLEELIEDRESQEVGQVYRSSPEALEEDVQGTYDAVGWTGGDELTNPTLRPARNLSKLEVAREEYESYVYAQFDAAMEHTNGNFLNREGAARKIDAMSLFSGPVNRVKKYGSEELQAFFGMRGRHTLASFRYGLYQWRTDRQAAVNAKTEGFEDVAHV
ncbi:hypothetical protein [Arthrobacter pigmenti]